MKLNMLYGVRQVDSIEPCYIIYSRAGFCQIKYYER